MYVQRVKSGGTQASGRQLSVLQSSGASKVSLPSREAKSEDSALALDFSKPARNDLEELLRKVRYGAVTTADLHAERIGSDQGHQITRISCTGQCLCRAPPLCLTSTLRDTISSWIVDSACHQE